MKGNIAMVFMIVVLQLQK